MKKVFDRCLLSVAIGILFQCEKPHEVPNPSPEDLKNNASVSPKEIPVKGVLKHQEWNDEKITQLIKPGQPRSSILKIAGRPFSSFSFNGITRDQYHFDNKFSEDDNPEGHLSGFSVEYENDTVVTVQLNFDKTFESKD